MTIPIQKDGKTLLIADDAFLGSRLKEITCANAGEIDLFPHSYGFHLDEEGNYVRNEPFTVNATPNTPFWKDAVYKGFNWGDAAGMLAIEGFLYYFTDSRTAMVLAVVLAVFMMAVRYLPAKVLSSRILKVLLIGSVLIIAAFTLALCVLYDPSVAWMAKLDSLFSGRLHLAHNCINDFGVTVFGQKVTLGGGSNYNRYTGKWVTGSSAHILDDAYARALIQCGIVYFVAGLALCTATMRKLYAQGQLHTLAIIAVIALYAIMESCALYLSYNIFLFLFAVLIEPPSPTLDPPPPSEQHANKSKSRGDFDLLPSETTYE